MDKIVIGRKEEYKRLDKCMREFTSQLVIVYGRRRVGKTFLINQYFNDTYAFKLTGAYSEPKEVQLEAFSEELYRRTGVKKETPNDWRQAFRELREYIEGISLSEKCVVFFDEMPWLDTHKSGFLKAFEFFWNDFGSARNNLVFIVCGSATSWLVDNIEHNKGGLFNRQSCKIFLSPFTLRETEEYLINKNFSWSRYDITELYMILGGIPYYLSLLDSSMSYSQNIDNLFFRRKSELWDEFDHLYNTLFKTSYNYIKIVSTLSKKKEGCTRTEICAQTGLPANGNLTKILKNLIDSGFVRENYFFGNKKRETCYQLADYYTCFYFHFLKGKKRTDEHFWSNSIDLPSRRVWSGLTFEQVCKDHVAQIRKSLGISGVLSEISSWSTKGDEELGVSGAQIDMLIDRRDRVITLCEMKFSVNDYIIDKDYNEKIRNKIESFRLMTKTRKAIQVVFVTTYGVKQNTYSSIVQSQVTLDDLFETAR